MMRCYVHPRPRPEEPAQRASRRACPELVEGTLECTPNVLRDAPPAASLLRTRAVDWLATSMRGADMSKAVVTCALTGVLTDPAVYPAPVTPAEMAREARRAMDAGASVVHVHFRNLEPGKGHLPSWAPEVATAVIGAIREACPDVSSTRRRASSDPTSPGRSPACAPSGPRSPHSTPARSII